MLHAASIVALATAALQQSPAKLREVPFPQVTIADAFWAPRREINRKISIPHSFDMLESSGNLKDLDLAAAGAREGYMGPVYMDSDLYKALEAASYSLATDRDPALERRVDAVLAKIAAAQRPDGYLNSWYQVNAPDKRFTNLRDHHELYCAGHLFEAAVAHFQATGKRTLLDVACRYADLLASTFGSGPGKRMGYCGHPEVELALVKLSRAAGTPNYFELAKFFLDSRGTHFFATEHKTPPERYDGTYWQDNVPIREHRAIVGHAVRAAYLMSGVVDVAGETGDKGLLDMVNRVWRNTTERNLYVTGGIGPSAANEGFTVDYDLPNLTAYQESCASVAMAMWNHRLNLLYGDAKYADLVELALYNGILSGVALDGKRFFYVNPLESRGDHHRSEWFGCACCPPNETRTLAALGNYAYASSGNDLWVNLYIQGGVATKLGGKGAALEVHTNYPWDGKVAIEVKGESGAEFPLRLRIPGWCEGAAARLAGAAVPTSIERGYLRLPRAVKPGDRVELDLPMPPRRIEADPNVADDRGKLAFARGPIVYAFEQCDQPCALASAAIPAGAAIETKLRPELLGGVTVLECQGSAADGADGAAGLYRTARPAKPALLTAIPYYAWDNRAPGAMRVWMPTAPAAAPSGGAERKAQLSVSFHNDNSNPEAVRDGAEPRNSNDNANPVCHFWPHKGTVEWIQYRWEKPIECAGVEVYWFDDTGRGECKIPASWRILSLDPSVDGEAWKPVAPSGAYEIAKDRWCEARFEKITTKGLRLEVQLQPGWAAGALEWRVIPPEER